MNYEEFKQIIGLIEVVDEKQYDQLVQKYGEKSINALFEQYINDSEIADDDKKFNRTSYYVEKTNENQVENEDLFKRLDSSFLSEDEYDRLFLINGAMENSIALYFKEIATFPLLEPEQEKELTLNLYKLKNKRESLKITDNNLDEELVAIGYKGTISKKYYSRKKQSKYIEEILVQLESKRESLKNKQSIFLSSCKEDEVNVLIKELDERIAYLKDLKEKIDIQHDYQEVFELLVNSNLRLVISIAKRYIRSDIPLLDLIQEGNKGLMKAIEKFNVTKGYKLSTYATWWIKQAITRSISNQSKLIRMPVYMVEQINKVVSVEKVLTIELGRKPTSEEIVNKLSDDKIDKDKIEDILKYGETRDPISFFEPISEDKSFTLEELIADETTNIEDNISQSHLKVALEEVLATLTEREEKIIKLRFGLDDGKIRTLEEIGQEFNLTRERIRQIEAKALKKLRKPEKIDRIKDFL